MPLVGSAVTRALDTAGYTNILTATRQQLDLRDQAEVSHWCKANRTLLCSLPASWQGPLEPTNEWYSHNVQCYLPHSGRRVEPPISGRHGRERLI